MFFGIGEGKVIYPAADEGIECLADLLYGLSTVTPRQASHFAAESLQAFRRNANTQPAGSSVEAKAQELAIWRSIHCAFGFVHLQPHPLLDKLFRACHHPLR